MTPQQLLFLWCVYSSLTVTCSFEVDEYSCVTSYWSYVTCVLSITADLMQQTNSSYNLEFVDTYVDQITCPLVLIDDSYRGVCNVTDSESLTVGDEFDINLCRGTDCRTLVEEFKPSEEIQLTPPYDVKVEQSPKTFNVSWTSGYEDHPYIHDDLDFELLVQTSESTENKTLHVPSQNLTLIERSELKPGAAYCFKVRSKVKSDMPDYKSIWSQWSPSACLKTQVEQEQDDLLLILIKSVGPACVAVGVLLLVLNSPTARMKIKTLSHTPSPAPFFKPLYQQHDGNLQDWLSPKGKLLQTYKPEEILTTDAVIVVPKPPITNDPEENQDQQNQSVTQFLFTQCPTSYVGLPGIHEPSPPVTAVSPGNMSYTRLPCSVWGINIGEVEVVSTPVKDVLHTSCADSGCSSEDLTQSPGCSLPNTPVEDSLPKCFCTDYCILNKTAEGFAPVLVSKGGSLGATAELQREDET
ncbi:interleukin 21 receptor, tandem duplicate 2 [Halichoeres trimaculatus]|uniref:interleukin 21 receptor, tandem duplicate 2 n=1 Tax=Halichoeres trimaculatus TaxID=147232 RepID=UPI003D9F6DF2